jgi:hypothetical protein
MPTQSLKHEAKIIVPLGVTGLQNQSLGQGRDGLPEPTVERMRQPDRMKIRPRPHHPLALASWGRRLEVDAVEVAVVVEPNIDEVEGLNVANA